MIWLQALLALLRVNQLEDVIEDEKAAGAVREQLKHLGIIHWPLLLVDLHAFFRVSQIYMRFTSKPPQRREMETRLRY